MIKRGDTVTFRPNWRDAGDEEIVFIATDDESAGRVTVQAQLDLTFNPTQVVTIDMIETVNNKTI